MAVDNGYGEKGYPKFAAGGGFQDWVDLEAVGAFAARVGNRGVGTRAEREALSTSTTAEKQAWEGLEFYETDTKETWLYQAGWKAYTTPLVIVGAASATRPRASYRLHAGVVQIIGVQAKPADTYGLFTLPAGFRPSGDHYYTDGGLTDPARQVLVRASGSVEYTHNAAHDVTYNIHFPAAA